VRKSGGKKIAVGVLIWVAWSVGAFDHDHDRMSEATSPFNYGKQSKKEYLQVSMNLTPHETPRLSLGTCHAPFFLRPFLSTLSLLSFHFLFRFSMFPVLILPLLLIALSLAQDGGIDGPVTSPEAAGYSCDPSQCRLPSCNCASTSPPGGVSPVCTSFLPFVLLPGGEPNKNWHDNYISTHISSSLS